MSEKKETSDFPIFEFFSTKKIHKIFLFSEISSYYDMSLSVHTYMETL